jgi:hypothetical protein
VTRLPLVLAVRALRTWNLYKPRLQVRQSGLHPPWIDDSGILAWYLVLPLTAYGVLLVRRRRMPLYALLAPALAATLASLIGFGSPRVFHAALAPLLVLAAAALVHLYESRARIAAALRRPERAWPGAGPAPAWAGTGEVASGESLAAQARHAFLRVFATRFSRRLGVITAIALAVKLTYVIHFAPQSGVSGDGQFYHYLANVLGGGHGFIRPFDYLQSHTYGPTRSIHRFTRCSCRSRRASGGPRGARTGSCQRSSAPALSPRSAFSAAGWRASGSVSWPRR